MSTIFDGYDKLNDKQIINQLAILETINLSNIFAFYKNKFKENTMETIKKLLGTPEKEELEDENANKTEQEKVNELYDYLLERRKELRKLSRGELDVRLKIYLCEKSNCDIEDSNEMISLAVVNEAMKRFSLPKYLTPAQKIDDIYEIYNDKVLCFLKENPDTANQNKVLDLGDPKLLIHIFIETIKSWDMIQGSKNIDRESLVESVWLAAMSHVSQFTPKLEDLPSFDNIPEEGEEYLGDIRYFNSIRDYEIAKDNLEINDYKLGDIEKEIDRYEKASINKKSELLEYNEKQKKTEKKLREIEVDLDYISNIYDEMQREIKNSDLVQAHLNTSQERLLNSQHIQNLDYQIKEADRILRNLGLDKEYFLKEQEKLKDLRDDTRRACLIQKDERYSELRNLWVSHFDKFDIDTEFLKEAIDFNIHDRIIIERALEELHDSKDPRIFSSNPKKDKKSNANQYNLEIILTEEKVTCIEYSIEYEEEDFKVSLNRMLQSTE